MGEIKSGYLTGGSPARLVLSLIVVFKHFGALSGLYRSSYLNADLAVECFFILSGYAMMYLYQRYDQKKNGIPAFYAERFFRIVGTVFFLVILQIIGLYIFSSCSLSDFFTKDLLYYFFANISLLNFLKQQMPCVLDTLWSKVVNGSLWTLKVEMGYYLLVPFFIMLFRKNGFMIWGILVASAAYRVLTFYYFPSIMQQLPGQICFFLIGMLLFKYPVPNKFSIWVSVVGLLWLLKTTFFGYAFLESLVAFPVILLALCHLLKKSENFFKKHDFSFTYYLIHWPIIQVLNVHFFSKNEWVTGLLLFLVLMLLIGYLFKRLVEDKVVIAGKNLSKYILQYKKQEAGA